MSLKRKTLVSVLLVGIVLIGGWWIESEQIYAETKEIIIATDKQNVVIEYELEGLTKVHIENNKIEYTYGVYSEEQKQHPSIASPPTEYATISAQISDEEVRLLLKIFEENNFFNLEEEYGDIGPYARYYPCSIRLKTDKGDKTVIYKDAGPGREVLPPSEFINIKQAILELVSKKFGFKILD